MMILMMTRRDIYRLEFTVTQIKRLKALSILGRKILDILRVTAIIIQENKKYIALHNLQLRSVVKFFKLIKLSNNQIHMKRIIEIR